MTRLYGWGERGKRLFPATPYGHWKTTEFVMELRCYKLRAPFIIDGAMGKGGFYTHMEQVPCPELNPDYIAICDNLASRKSAGIKKQAEQVGAEIK